MSEQKISYMQVVHDWLVGQVLPVQADETVEQWGDRVVRQIKDKLLESYRNGQAAGPTRKPKQK